MFSDQYERVRIAWGGRREDQMTEETNAVICGVAQ